MVISLVNRYTSTEPGILVCLGIFTARRCKQNSLSISLNCCTIPARGGVRVCGDAVLRYFWCGFAVIFILTRGIAVLKHLAVCGYYNL